MRGRLLARLYRKHLFMKFPCDGSILDKQPVAALLGNLAGYVHLRNG